MRRYKIETDNGIYMLDADDFAITDVLHLTRRDGVNDVDGKERETVAIFPMNRLVALTDITDQAIEDEEGEIMDAISILSLQRRFVQLVNRLKAGGVIPTDWKAEDEG